MNAGHNVDTDEYPISTSPTDGPPPRIAAATVRADLAGLSDVGRVRPNNEDHFLVVRFDRALQTLLTNLPEGLIPPRAEEVGYGMVVADGMGGMAAGEVASRLAIRTLVDLALSTPDWVLKKGTPEIERVMQRMAERYRRVDEALRDEAQADPDLSGMGTTMTLACSIGSDLVLAHVGDSRAYLMRDGELHLLTRDHTLVQELVDRGVVRPENASTHPFRHVLTRYLGGGKGNLITEEVQRVSLADGDQLLLCTDGLTDMVDAAAVKTVLRSSASADDACQALVDLALQQGGRDNVTVVLARYRFAPGP
jgi:protein phosphatase